VPELVGGRQRSGVDVYMGWHRYVGLDGAVVDMHAFSTPAPLQDVKNRLASPAGNLEHRQAAAGRADRRAGR
jgi:hypothetical protein